MSEGSSSTTGLSPSAPSQRRPAASISPVTAPVASSMSTSTRPLLSLVEEAVRAEGPGWLPFGVSVEIRVDRGPRAGVVGPEEPVPPGRERHQRQRASCVPGPLA